MTVVLLRPAPVEVPAATYVIGLNRTPDAVGARWAAAAHRAAGLRPVERRSPLMLPVDVLPLTLSHAPARRLNAPRGGQGLITPVGYRGRAFFGIFYIHIREVSLFHHAPTWRSEPEGWRTTTWDIVLRAHA